MNKHYLCVLALLAGSLPALAQDPEPDAEPEVEAEPSSPFSGTLSLDYATQYIYRGIWLENQGLILQPTLDLSLKVFEFERGGLDSISLFAGTFHSFHWGPTGADGDSNDPWFEVDGYGGVSFGLLENLELAAGYYRYASPNNAFDTVEELVFGLSLDDGEFWNETVKVGIEGFQGFQPSITLAHEIYNQSDASPEGHEGTYLELAIEPGFTLVNFECCPISLSVPTALGLSLADYYEDETGNDETFGFVQTGLQFTVPLSLILCGGHVPSSAGSWEFSTGGQVLFLGDHATAFTDRGQEIELIFTAGLSVSF